MSDPDSPQPNSLETRIRSVPALAAALRRSDSPKLSPSFAQPFTAESLVPMYKVDARLATEDVQAEAAAVAKVVGDISERLRRMGTAYGEWEVFDGAAYFDLLTDQVEWLVRMTERVSTVNVTFFVDLLIPSFRTAQLYWCEHFHPAYLAAHASDQDEDGETFAAFFETAQPEMVIRWNRLVAVVHETRALLANDIGWMATNGGEEERFLQREAWQQTAAENLDQLLTPTLQTIPSLTRSLEFVLPVHRQSGRQQRLRRNRERTRRDEQRAV